MSTQDDISNIRPFQDFVILQPNPRTVAFASPFPSSNRPELATVVAVGPGCYLAPDTWYSPEVEVGDTVCIFPWQKPAEIEIGGESLLVMPAHSLICAIGAPNVIDATSTDATAQSVDTATAPAPTLQIAPGTSPDDQAGDPPPASTASGSPSTVDSAAPTTQAAPVAPATDPAATNSASGS
jgi:co-chaperonin GroES (HSP10)